MKEVTIGLLDEFLKIELLEDECAAGDMQACAQIAGIRSKFRAIFEEPRILNRTRYAYRWPWPFPWPPIPGPWPPPDPGPWPPPDPPWWMPEFQILLDTLYYGDPNPQPDLGSRLEAKIKFREKLTTYVAILDEEIERLKGLSK